MIVDDLQANGGMITRDDLAATRSASSMRRWSATYRGYTLHGIPQSSGCITAYEALNILEQFDLASLGAGSAARRT